MAASGETTTRVYELVMRHLYESEGRVIHGGFPGIDKRMKLKVKVTDDKAHAVSFYYFDEDETEPTKSTAEYSHTSWDANFKAAINDGVGIFLLLELRQR